MTRSGGHDLVSALVNAATAGPERAEVLSSLSRLRPLRLSLLKGLSVN